MTARTVWRENDLHLFNLLEQISNLNDSTYDEKNEWIDDVINMLQQEHQLN
jgi:hypothetical protein